MSVTTVRRIDQIVLPGGTFSHISEQDHDPAISEFAQMPAGQMFPSFRGNENQRPVIRFGTPQLDIALSQIGTIGSAPGAVNAYHKIADKTGLVARANTSHDLTRINMALLYLDSIRLPHQGVGEARVIVVACYDGFNNPFVYTQSVALPAAIAANDFWGAGPVKLNGSLVGAIKEIDYQSGINIVYEGGESEQWDSFAGIETGDPVVTIRTLHPVNLATAGLAGSSLDGVDGLEFYARKHGPNGPVANGTAQHIYFQALRGKFSPQNISGQGSSSVSDTLRVSLNSSDGEATALSGSVASVIS